MVQKRRKDESFQAIDCVNLHEYLYIFDKNKKEKKITFFLVVFITYTKYLQFH